MASIEKITTTEGCLIGEGPHWDAASQSLYFADVFGQAIVKYTPSTNTVSKSKFDEHVTFIIPIANRKEEYVVSLSNQLVVISWNGEEDEAKILQILCIVDASKTFGDGKCDSLGRLWAGTHSIDQTDFYQTRPLGALYSIDETKQLKQHVDQVHVSNGIAFNDKIKKMFFIDSLNHTVDRFDFDITSGIISNRQVWFTLKKSNVPGTPDGMTIDVDGNLWVAAIRGARVLKIDGHTPETLLQTVNLPADQVTSVVFGGDNLDELYVTTGNMTWSSLEGGPNPTCNGAILKITGLGTRGLPAADFKLN